MYYTDIQWMNFANAEITLSPTKSGTILTLDSRNRTAETELGKHEAASLMRNLARVLGMEGEEWYHGMNVSVAKLNNAARDREIQAFDEAEELRRKEDEEREKMFAVYDWFAQKRWGMKFVELPPEHQADIRREADEV